MYSDKAFEEYLAKRGVKVKIVAAAMGISVSALYRKRKGMSDFTLGEIRKCCEFFGVKNMNDVFFADEVA